MPYYYSNMDIKEEKKDAKSNISMIVFALGVFIGILSVVLKFV